MNLLFLIASSPAMAVADPNIQLDMSVAKEIVVEQDGEQVRRWVEASDVQPGEKLMYTVNYVNTGDEPATEVKIENPIPDLTVYVSDSASGENSKIVFSADGGKTFASPEEVTYEVAVFGGGTDRRKASPARYTNIRWLIDEIPPGASGEVSFVVTVQ
ncbi:MAG: hypothetical protein U5O39_15330 [Gammaproteobacteria bacterium]|nr:hypothetical protein [Gammaproteobacteria bacterium]